MGSPLSPPLSVRRYLQEAIYYMTAEQADALIQRLEELLVVLGNVQGYILFFVVVVLFYFAYRFLRMFF